MKNLKEYAINFIITIIIFAAIFYLFDLNKVIEVISKSNYYFLGAALIAYSIVLIIMSIRINIILKKLKYSVPFLSVLESNFAGMLASDFTPARSGYFFTSFSLSSKHKIPINDAILTIFGPQLFDFVIKVTSLAVIVLLLLNTMDGLGKNILITIIAIAGIFALILFFGALVFVKGFLQKFLFINKLPFGGKIYGLFNLMQEKSSKLMDIKWEIIGITFASWTAKSFEWFLIAKALGVTIFDGGIYDFAFMMVFQGSITLIQFIPLPTIAGGGASEIGFSGVLLAFGVPIETGIAFALLTRGVMIALDIFGIGELLRYIRKEGLGKIIKEIDSLEQKRLEQ